LVDETVNKKVTFDKCDNLKIKSYSLPIDKYMKRKILQNKDFNYNKVLAINQVFDILANFYINKNWPKSLEIGIPKRKGFEVGVDDGNSLKLV
jgi:tRNA (guanine9-N1)-methyltransferase